MPTYDYECSTGHRFEVFQKMSDEPVAACPDCGKPASRLISGGAGFLFKGEGFYITDSRSDDYKKKASADGPGNAGGAAGSNSTSSDSGSGSSQAGSKSDGGGSASSSGGGSKESAGSSDG